MSEVDRLRFSSKELQAQFACNGVVRKKAQLIAIRNLHARFRCRFRFLAKMFHKTANLLTCESASGYALNAPTIRAALLSTRRADRTAFTRDRKYGERPPPTTPLVERLIPPPGTLTQHQGRVSHAPQNHCDFRPQAAPLPSV